jgi:hypothetical protein
MSLTAGRARQPRALHTQLVDELIKSVALVRRRRGNLEPQRLGWRHVGRRHRHRCSGRCRCRCRHRAGHGRCLTHCASQSAPVSHTCASVSQCVKAHASVCMYACMCVYVRAQVCTYQPYSAVRRPSHRCCLAACLAQAPVRAQRWGLQPQRVQVQAPGRGQAWAGALARGARTWALQLRWPLQPPVPSPTHQTHVSAGNTTNNSSLQAHTYGRLGAGR